MKLNCQKRMLRNNEKRVGKKYNSKIIKLRIIKDTDAVVSVG